MPTWFFILAATAFGGALVLWHSVSSAKHVAETLLDRYRQMLTQARDEKAQQLAKEAADAENTAKEEAS